jgi:ubiquinone biosynthesis protein
MSRLARLLRILAVGLRFGLYDLMPGPRPGRFVVRLARLAGRLVGADTRSPRGVRLRCALETLGPIFVKFGQVLSTRRDLLPMDIADELAKLQDQVPPFASDVAVAEIERSLGRRVDEVFWSFERDPVASASIAQVHLGKLADGREVAVKVLRPGVEAAVARDLMLLETAAVGP